jgi:hypothetical protein
MHGRGARHQDEAPGTKRALGAIKLELSLEDVEALVLLRVGWSRVTFPPTCEFFVEQEFPGGCPPTP